ncbi:Addiction module toxin, RelE/StbE family (fragment) [Nitrospira lenta]|uniref:Addiction module toxin, RelE/StbE family n=1 Tax=Nitrospira lenta TaxID=1436998 RepID=A0A330LAW4_9BACT
MKYRLVYSHRAIRDIDALESKVKQRIGKTLLRYESDPLKYAETLKQSELGSY